MDQLEKKIEATVAPSFPPQVAGQGAQAGTASPPVAKPENLPAGMPGRGIPLKFPFKSGDKILSEVVFTRRPKARDLIQHVGATTAAEQELYGIAALIGVVPEDLMEMDGADYLAVQKEWAVFLTI